MKHTKSKFVWDARNMVLVSGKLPTRDQQLFKGEDLNGEKMEIVCCDRHNHNDIVAYWGWSS